MASHRNPIVGTTAILLVVSAAAVLVVAAAPAAIVTGQRGGIHNSVTRAVLKPTHMIGGYAQQSYGFNYYGTVGSTRDEFVIVRKVDKVDWLEGPATHVTEAAE